MAGRGSVVIKILGDAAGLKRGLSDAEGALGGFSTKVDSFSSKMSSFGNKLTVGVTLPVIGFLTQATKAAAEDEAAQVSLAKTLENTTGATESQVGAVENQITAFTKVSAFTDDELRPAYANLVRATRDVESASALMGTAMDIAAARGLPLETVSLALAKAHDGNVGALSRLGVQTKDAEGKTLEFEAVMKNAEKTFGGSAAAALDTSAGRARALRRDMGELTEEVGAQLLPAMNSIVGFVSEKLIPTLDGLSGDNGAVILLAAALAGPLITSISKLQLALTSLAAHPVWLLLASVPAGIAVTTKSIEGFRDEGLKGLLKEGFFPRLLRDLNIFHQGGVVPGSPGETVPILARAGERVIPAGETVPIPAGAGERVIPRGANGSRGTLSITVNARTDASARAIADEIDWMMRTRGY